MRPAFTWRQDRWLRHSFRFLIGGIVVSAALSAVLVETGADARLGRPVAQPVPFSHQHHAGELGIDCRYCHVHADTSAFAGMPDTHTCMTCHSQIWTEAEALAPVRESYRNGEPIVWNRVHDLADFVYFDHSAHVNRGVDCTRCHGNVDTMPLVWQDQSLTMEWCLECHASEEAQAYVGEGGLLIENDPHQGLFDREATSLKKELPLKRIENCSVCHR